MVTAFIIESYKMLLPDNIDYVAHALYILVAQNGANRVDVERAPARLWHGHPDFLDNCASVEGTRARVVVPLTLSMHTI